MDVWLHEPELNDSEAEDDSYGQKVDDKINDKYRVEDSQNRFHFTDKVLDKKYGKMGSEANELTEKEIQEVMDESCANPKWLFSGHDPS